MADDELQKNREAMAEALRRRAARGPGVQRRSLADALRELPPAAREAEALYELADQVITHLQEKWGEEKACPYCDANDWQVGKLIWFDAADGSEYPAVPVLCANCANTTFVNPLAAGFDLTDLKGDE